MSSQRVIFLDVDGVLNSVANRFDGIDRVNVEQLNRLVEQTGAYVVISSTWRSLGTPMVAEILRNHGFTGDVRGITPHLLRSHRGLEIEAFLREPDDRPTSIVILDDDNDMGAMLPFLVQTDARVGLTDGDVERAVAILEAQP